MNTEQQLRERAEAITCLFAVTGTFHGSIVEAKSEGDARREFHRYYNGESILYIRLLPNNALMYI